jgi:prevent-host-death family protein
MVMTEISASEFKAKCLAILDEVNKTKKSVRITKRGKVIAELVPASPPKEPKGLLGRMKGQGKIIGDIVAPATDPEEWEVLRD